jgi:hypothetical protein
MTDKADGALDVVQLRRELKSRSRAVVNRENGIASIGQTIHID